jgi:glycosyltransferase involved in cell wall biosynthesis
VANSYLKRGAAAASARAGNDETTRSLVAPSDVREFKNAENRTGKTVPKVSVFRDFAEDGRTSMDVYADGLTSALREYAGSRFVINERSPRPLNFLPRKPGNLRMRASRHVYYPWFARSRRGDINHIVDHGYAYLLRTLDPARTVVTVHDLIPLLSWKGCLPGPTRYPHRPVLFERALQYLRRAERILAVSENTKRDLIHHCGCCAERIRVVYSGVASWCRMYDAEGRLAVRRKLGLPDSQTRLVLITGSGLQWYKNHPTCLKVLARLVESCPWPVKMIRSGDATTEWLQVLADSGMQRHYIEVPRLGEHTAMVDIYNAVDCLLFPSWYEGFGWPPLEAMACGIPVVASDAASLPEIVGDAGLMCAPDDVEGLTTAVWSFLRRDGVNKRFTDAGLRRAATFTWRRCVEQVCQTYDSLIAGAPCS